MKGGFSEVDVVLGRLDVAGPVLRAAAAPALRVGPRAAPLDPLTVLDDIALKRLKELY